MAWFGPEELTLAIGITEHPDDGGEPPDHGGGPLDGFGEDDSLGSGSDGRDLVGGCAVGGGTPGPALWLVVIAGVIAAGRRRRQASSDC